MKKVKKSKVISGSGICEWGGTLADVETSYNYQKAFDRYFAGITENVLVHAIHGDEAARSTYDEKLGAITADVFYFRSSQGQTVDTHEKLAGLWVNDSWGRISSVFIPYGHQVCENADDDGLTEVCARQHVYHKRYHDEHEVHVDNLSFCLTFNEDYKMTKFMGVGPNVAWKTDVHGLTFNYCAVGACDGQGEGETVIWEF